MRDLKNSKLIHEEAVAIARAYLGAEKNLLATLIKVDVDRTYELHKCTHLTPYCTRILGLEKDVAKCFVRVVRKSHSIPELAASVLSGEVSLYKARVLTSVITQENKSEWLAKAKLLSKAKLEREIAESKLKKTQPIKLDLKHETIDMLTRTQEILSSKTQTFATREDAIHWSLSETRYKHDPVQKAERSRGSSLKHEITKRDQERCQFIYEDSTQCEERK